MKKMRKCFLRSIEKACKYGLAVCLVVACTDTDKFSYKEPSLPTEKDYFDYATTKSIKAEIDYGLKDYRVIFELFAENPLSENETGEMTKTAAEPLYRGVTDENGKFEEEIVLPSYIEEAYLYCDYLGTVSPVRLSVGNGKIVFVQKEVMKRTVTRALTPSGKSYPDGFLSIGDWDNTGYPNYLLPEQAKIDAQTLYDIKAALGLGGGQQMQYFHPEYIADNVNIEIKVVKPTTVKLAVLTTTASMQNVLGYYTYSTGQTPKSAKEIKRIISFPRISVSNCNSVNEGSLYFGDQVQLKYWDEENQEFKEEFPAGVSIGWFIMSSAFNKENGSIVNRENWTYYSTRALNLNNQHRTIALKDREGKKTIAIGLEDNNGKDYQTNTGVGNFGDAVFYLDFGDADAIHTEGIPDIPESDPITDKDLYTFFWGSLAFEDLWPNQGDYDMNDVVMKYERKVYRNIITNQVTKVIDKFIPLNDGAIRQNGFGYQFTGIASSLIKDIKIESEKGTSSRYMTGNTEAGQNWPTILLFDNMKEVVSKNESFTVTIEFLSGCRLEMLTPFHKNYPYNFNPFIVIESNAERGREAHLAKFPPTALADMSYFKQGNDASQPENGLYYVTKENWPTALHLSGVDFDWPDEKVRIDETYPKFVSWAESFGTKDAQWYKTKKK